MHAVFFYFERFSLVYEIMLSQRLSLIPRLLEIFLDFNYKTGIWPGELGTDINFRKMSFSEYMPGPSSHSKSVLKHCIPIVYRRPSTVSVYPKSMLLPHYVQSIRIYTFFLKIYLAFFVLIPMMFIAKSWKIVKISKKNLKLWAMHFLSMMMPYNLKTLQATY